VASAKRMDSIPKLSLGSDITKGKKNTLPATFYSKLEIFNLLFLVPFV